MKTILILQNEIMPYRKPVYNGLAEHYDVAVLHSGRPSVGADDRYCEEIVPQKKIGPFHLQHRVAMRKRFQQCDVVIAMFDLRWPAYLFPLFHRRRSKYILWGHRYSGNRFANIIRDQLMKRADRLLMYGDEEIPRMIERGIDPGRIVVAWNTTHVPNHKDYSAAQKSSLLFVGRLQRPKRVDLLIEVFARLQGHIDDTITVDIVGSGEEEVLLRQCAAEHGLLDKVNFHGRIDDPDMLAVAFSKAFAYISPGPIGLGALHSLAYGVPVVTSGAVRYGPEFYNLRHKHNAILFETVQEMEQAIEQLCTNRDYAAELGRNAYAHYAEKRTLDHMLAGFREAIEN